MAYEPFKILKELNDAPTIEDVVQHVEDMAQLIMINIVKITEYIDDKFNKIDLDIQQLHYRIDDLQNKLTIVEQNVAHTKQKISTPPPPPPTSSISKPTIVEKPKATPQNLRGTILDELKILFEKKKQLEQAEDS